MKALKQEAKKTESALKALKKLNGIKKLEANTQILKTELDSELEDLRAEEKALCESLQARIEDTTVFCRTFTKPSGKVYEAWYAHWREGPKTRTQYLSACSKMSQEEALEKARRLKRESLEKLAQDKQSVFG